MYKITWNLTTAEIHRKNENTYSLLISIEGEFTVKKIENKINDILKNKSIKNINIASSEIYFSDDSYLKSQNTNHMYISNYTELDEWIDTLLVISEFQKEDNIYEIIDK